MRHIAELIVGTAFRVEFCSWTKAACSFKDKGRGMLRLAECFSSTSKSRLTDRLCERRSVFNEAKSRGREIVHVIEVYYESLSSVSGARARDQGEQLRLVPRVHVVNPRQTDPREDV